MSTPGLDARKAEAEELLERLNTHIRVREEAESSAAGADLLPLRLGATSATIGAGLLYVGLTTRVRKLAMAVCLMGMFCGAVSMPRKAITQARMDEIRDRASADPVGKMLPLREVERQLRGPTPRVHDD
eukprot:TRINITY_DN30086_c0_g1_i1.p1 TRINITY_DN30086_c0_g1~~TRINITY_DN30086_c0_g1_i1.p1  ORF type:complete len:143 (+),score=29.20 TRINITY_DN30086_c0_g1_i1:45-431(+)